MPLLCFYYQNELAGTWAWVSLVLRGCFMIHADCKIFLTPDPPLWFLLSQVVLKNLKLLVFLLIFYIFSNTFGLIRIFCCATFSHVSLLTIQNCSITQKGNDYKIMVIFLKFLTIIISIKWKYYKLLSPRSGI